MKEATAGPGRVQAPRGAVLPAQARVESAARSGPPAAAGMPGPAAPGAGSPGPVSRPASEAGALGPSTSGPPTSGATSGMSTPGTPGAPSKRPVWGAPPAATGRDADWAEQLEALRQEALVCRKCALCETRSQVVFAGGDARVPLVFVGEAPGADEDRQGFPFVGRAGQLLTKIIEAIGLDREQVYICNILKCRPPENRNPAPDEILACGPYLTRQLEILKPKVICTLGLFASQYLLETSEPIGKLRGRWFAYRGIPVMPTYHPAALLRNPNLKATVWEDVQLLRKKLDE
ncbi:MAG: uracil-DNA glycosylase [Candidatus Eisenbacteria bacterium]|nr:uracil-DNA glycosylase [Candidatus Eisenbacteria bacterium]